MNLCVARLEICPTTHMITTFLHVVTTLLLAFRSVHENPGPGNVQLVSVCRHRLIRGWSQCERTHSDYRCQRRKVGDFAACIQLGLLRQVTLQPLHSIIDTEKKKLLE